MRSCSRSCASPSPLPRLSFARAALCVGLFAFLPSSDSHAVTFSDTEFADADWTTVLVHFGNPGASGGIASGFQVGSGGNPGAYRRSEVGFPSAAGVTEIVIGNHLRAGAVYDPSTQGAIDTIDLSYDVFIEPNSAAFGGIVLRQAGTYYYRPIQDPDASQAWVNQVAPARLASSFAVCEGLFGALCAGAGTGNPDFSTSGGPIEFGFWQAVAATSLQARTFDSRIDNWSVTVNSVPEPGTATLLLAGLLLASRARGRRR